MPELWPFPPLTPLTETLSGMSWVGGAYSAEQRQNLRGAYRQRFEFRHIFGSPAEAEWARSLLRMNVLGQWYVPDWSDPVRLGPVSAAATSVAFTVDQDFRAGEFLLLWQSLSAYSLVQIATVGASSISLSSPVGLAMTAPVVVPVRFGYLVDGGEVSERNAVIGRAKVSFSCPEGVDLSASPYAVYEGFDLMTDAPLIDTVSHGIEQAADYADNGQGPVVIEATQSFANGGGELEWRDRDRYRRRRWLHSLRGRAKAFWLPTFVGDLTLLSDIGAADVAIDVAASGPAEIFDGRHILIRSGGAAYAREITNASVDSSGSVATLTITALGTAVPVSGAVISFMRLVRSDADDFDLSHHQGGQPFTDTKMSVREVGI